MDVCPDCEHGDRKPRRPSLIRRWLGLAPLPAACREIVHGPSGYAEQCSCSGPWHGS